MIKEKTIIVNINNRNSTHYRVMGYIFEYKEAEKNGLEVNIVDVPAGSQQKITAICHFCSGETTIQLNKYWKNYHRHDKNFYSCFGCKNNVKVETCIQKYGVDSYSKTDNFKENQSSLRKGIDVGADKRKATNLEKYGVEHYFQTDESREYNRAWMSSDEFKEKSKLTLINIYGVDSYSKTNEFKSYITLNKETITAKIVETFRKNYGVDWISQSEIWKEKFNNKLYDTIKKIKDTCIEKYGVDNVIKVDDVLKKAMATKVEKGFAISGELLSEWNLYKRKVRNITKMYKIELYDNWDGYDYYDNEFIKEYTNLNHTERSYPTIDHKISVMHGFTHGIDPEIIGNINNLCVTKRYINSMKNSMIAEDFINQLSELI
jgi:hypothetical protein